MGILLLEMIGLFYKKRGPSRQSPFLVATKYMVII